MFQSRPLPVIEKDVDGAFLTKESYEILLAGDFVKVPIMLGTTSEEAVYAADGKLDIFKFERVKLLLHFSTKIPTLPKQSSEFVFRNSVHHFLGLFIKFGPVMIFESDYLQIWIRTPATLRNMNQIIPNLSQLKGSI